MSVRLLAEVRGLVVLLAVLALHLLVLGQLALQVVGLGPRGQQVGRRRLAPLPGLLFPVVDGAVLVGRDPRGATAAAAGGDEPARATLARGLAHGHGGL